MKLLKRSLRAWLRRRLHQHLAYSQAEIAEQLDHIRELRAQRERALQLALLRKSEGAEAEVGRLDSALEASETILNFMLDKNVKGTKRKP